MSRASGFVLAAALGCSSSHGAAFTRAMNEADDASERGEPLLAARRFDQAAEVATSPRDRDDARHAAARLRVRGGELALGLAQLDALARESPPGPETPSSLYDSAALRIDHREAGRGWHDLEEVLLRFPNDGVARPALHRWLTHMDDEQGPRATLAWLRQVAARLDRTDRAEEISYETALRLEQTGDPADARDAFLATATRWPYPNGALWDDALYHASLLDEAAGHPALAVADLTRMLSRREKALFVGSAERPRYAEAQLHLGELYRDKLADPERARAAFHSLYADFDESTLRDRGLYEEAELDRSLGERGGACARYETLVREFPDSRYASCAVARCPTMAARPGKGAATPCRDYINARAARTPETMP